MAGFFAVRFEQIAMPDGQVGKRLQSSLPDLSDIPRRFAGAILDFVVPQAEAADLTVTDASPEIVFDDTDLGSDWRIFTNHQVIGGTVSVWRLFKGASTQVIDIQADEATQANLLNSLLINPTGDLQFANGGMFFDRANVRLGIGLATPAVPESKLHVQGQSPQLVVANDAGNVRMDLRRSRSRGSSQLLFGTGPVATGKKEFQVGMFKNSVFQIRSSGNSRKSITL
jgi:hypothetical protein